MPTSSTRSGSHSGSPKCSASRHGDAQEEAGEHHRGEVGVDREVAGLAAPAGEEVDPLVELDRQRAVAGRFLSRRARLAAEGDDRLAGGGVEVDVHASADQAHEVAEGDLDAVDAGAGEGRAGDGELPLVVDRDAEGEVERRPLDPDVFAEVGRDGERAGQVEGRTGRGHVERPGDVDRRVADDVVEAALDGQRAAEVVDPLAFLVAAQGELSAQGHVTDLEVVEAERDRPEVPRPHLSLAERVDGDREREEVVLRRRRRRHHRSAEADHGRERQAGHRVEVEVARDLHLEGVEVLPVGEGDRYLGDVEGKDAGEVDRLQEALRRDVDALGAEGSVAVQVESRQRDAQPVERGDRGLDGGDDREHRTGRSGPSERSTPSWLRSRPRLRCWRSGAGVQREAAVGVERRRDVLGPGGALWVGAAAARAAG